DDALRVRVAGYLGLAFDDPHRRPHLPVLAERHSAVFLAGLRWQPRAVQRREHRLLTDELPFEPRDLAGIAAVRVDVDVLAEERVAALRARQAPHATERRQVQPRVVLPEQVEVADADAADALQIERLDQRI